MKDSKLMDDIKKEAVDTVDDLYVNRWANTLDTTAKQIEEGKIDRHTLSTPEMTFVPPAQHAKHQKLGEQEFERMLDEEMKKRSRKR